MRIVLLSVLALVVLAGAGSAAPVFILHRATSPGWIADQFTTTDTFITVTLEAVGGEEFATLTHLYDGQGNLLRSRHAVFHLGNSQDASVRAASTEATTDTVFLHEGEQGRDVVNFLCNSACNPSRQFTLVTMAAGDNVSSWAFGVQANGASAQGTWSGSRVGFVPGHEFNGQAVRVAAAPALGASATQGMSLAVAIQDHFTGAFSKTGSAAPLGMTLGTPAGSKACPCPKEGYLPAGTYRFGFDDVSTSPDEVYALWADIRLS